MFRIEGIRPLAMAKQIITMLLVVNGVEFTALRPDLREFVLDRDRTGLRDIQLYLALYLGPVARFVGVSGKTDSETGDQFVMTEIAYPPFSYLASLDEPPPLLRVGNVTGLADIPYATRATLDVEVLVGFGHTPLPTDFRTAAQVERIARKTPRTRKLGVPGELFRWRLRQHGPSAADRSRSESAATRDGSWPEHLELHNVHEELRAWLDDDRQWDQGRGGNWQSLLADAVDSLTHLGEATKLRLNAPSLAQRFEACRRLFEPNKPPEDLAIRRRMCRVLDELEGHREPVVLVAAWRDLLDAVKQAHAADDAAARFSRSPLGSAIRPRAQTSC